MRGDNLMNDRNTRAGGDRFGEITAIVGVVLYVAAIVFFVLPLSRKLDTFLVISWLFVPAIVGALIYMKIERSGGWSQSRHLR
jgi:uncharacterized membrane protein HdeD (DUF308 family)